MAPQEAIGLRIEGPYRIVELADGIHGLFQVRDELRDIVDLTIVAFPQLGLLRRPGTVDDVARVARAYFDPTRMTVVSLGPKGTD